MRCAISGRQIESADEAVAFPPFVANEADPLHVFSDSVVHAEVFRTHPLAMKAQARLEEARQRTAAGNRRCVVCGRLVTDPEDYLGFGHLVEDRSHPLHRFNFSHFHRSCLATWRALPGLIRDLEALEKSGAWKGDGLKRMISVLQDPSARR
jgi:hypothetical protein